MFRLIAIAGTFDRLHKGHEFFIKQAFNFGEKVIIGLTTDRYVKSKVNRPAGGQNSKLKLKIQNYQERKKELEDFLRGKRLLDRVEIVSIDDIYGPTVDKVVGEEIEALVVTSETQRGGKAVNKRRKEKGLKFLKLIKVSLIPAEDKKKIASTRIRLGEIDRWGRLYKNFQFSIHNFQKKGKEKYQIDEKIRQELKRPLGRLIKGEAKNHLKVSSELKKVVSKLKPTMIITVGDEVTKLLNQIGLSINLAVVDFKVKRKPVYRSFQELGFDIESDIKVGIIETVRNPAGSITPSLVSAIKKAIKGYVTGGKSKIIKVLGEEDLAGVPAILLSPLSSIVIYGQPDEGVVAVEVKEKMKRRLFRMFTR